MSETDQNPKERVLSILEQLPDDSSFDQILHELAFVRMIERVSPMPTPAAWSAMPRSGGKPKRGGNHEQRGI